VVEAAIEANHPALLGGALAIVTNVGRDAMDAEASLDERRLWRTAKSCGPDIPTLISGATRERCHPRRQPSPVSGASTKQTVKTNRAGKAGSSGVPVVTNSCAFYFAHEAAGAACIRLSLRPLFAEWLIVEQNSGALCRERCGFAAVIWQVRG
jgi:hypothetical protein